MRLLGMENASVLVICGRELSVAPLSLARQPSLAVRRAMGGGKPLSHLVACWEEQGRGNCASSSAPLGTLCAPPHCNLARLRRNKVVSHLNA